MEEFIKEILLKMQTGEFSFIFLFVAFLGGLLASLSPCSIGILPIIAGYVGGYGDSTSDKANLKNFLQLLFFVLGLSCVLTVIGVVCALTGKVFASALGAYWVLLIASLLLVMGLNLIGAIELNLPVIVKKMPKGDGKSFFLYPFCIGAIFALATTPCSTPILAGIMSFATLSKNLIYAALMLFLFALGQGVIIILVGLSASFLKNAKRFTKFSEILLKVSGALLILCSIFIYYKVFSVFF